MALIDLQACDWSKVEVTLSGKGYGLKGITSINYGTSIERTKVYGAGAEAYDFTPGVKNAEDVEMEVSVVEWNNLVETIGRDVLEDSILGRFDMTVNYRMKDGNPISVRLEEMAFQAESRAHAQGPDNLVVTVTFTCLKVVR